MEKIELFSNPIWKVKIPPESYNKQELLDVIEHNYNLQPVRNAVVPTFHSNAHHYYRDWDNPKFKKINIDPLTVIYDELIKEFGSNFKFNQPTFFEYEISNIHASKENQSLRIHDHSNKFYSTVHYLSLKKEHRVTRFYNPLIIAHYNSTVIDTKDFMANDISNSNYFHYWNLEVYEDEMVFFPAYFKHEVVETEETDNLRVTISTNISLRGIGQ
jgi:hypothetical protein